MNININNRDKLIAALNQSQKRARTRLIHSSEVKKKSLEATRFIKNKYGIKAQEQVGCEVTYVNGWGYRTFPNAYRGIPLSTHFKLTRRKSGWYLTDVFRSRANIDEKFILTNEENVMSKDD